MVNFRLWLVTIGLGAFLNLPAGYQFTSINIPAGAFRSFINQTTHFKESENWIISVWSLIVSIRILGVAIGSFIARSIADSLGRRDTLLVALVPAVCGDVLSIISFPCRTWYPLLLGRLVGGVADGMFQTCMPMLVLEAAPPATRGKCGVMLMLMRELGMLIGLFATGDSGLGSESRLRYLFLFSLVIFASALVWIPLIPRSPRFLYITKRNESAAFESLKFYQRDASEEDILKTMGILEKAASASANQQNSQQIPTMWVVLRSRNLRRALIVTISQCIALPFAGRFIFMAYSYDSFMHAGLTAPTAHILTIIIQCFSVPCLMIDIALMDRIKRRTMIATASLIVATLQLLVMICFFVRDNQLQSSSSLPIHHLSNVTTSGSPISLGGFTAKELVSLGGYAALRSPQSGTGSDLSYLISAGLMAWLPALIIGIACFYFLPTELFPQDSRSSGMAIAVFVTFSAGTVTSQVYPILENIRYGYGELFLMIPFVLTSVVLVYFLPETRNRPVEEICEEMKSIWPVRGGTNDAHKESGLVADYQSNASSLPIVDRKKT